jgi:hypothetical protein
MTQVAPEDRVQWFRAHAETMRWLEEFELKHVEFMRCIKSFETMRAIWGTISKRHDKPGYAAFAQRQADMYEDLRDDAISRFKHVANPRLLRGDIRSLTQAISEFRRDQLSWLFEAAKKWYFCSVFISACRSY